MLQETKLTDMDFKTKLIDQAIRDAIISVVGTKIYYLILEELNNNTIMVHSE